MKKIKQHFLTGLAVILPIILTYFIVHLLLKLLTAPFVGMLQPLIHLIDPNERHPDLVIFFSRVALIFLLFLMTVLIGFLGKAYFIHALIRFGDRIAHRVPLANKIYKAVQDVMQSLIDQEQPSFSQVVQVPFPHEKAIAFGFITKEQEIQKGENEKRSHVSVFLPGTPNPTMGFILLIPKEKIQVTPLKVEEAIKFIVSCGVIRPAAPRSEGQAP